MLYREQLDAFFPGRERAIKRVMKRCCRSGHIYYNQLTGIVAVNETAARRSDHGALLSLWVLAELKQKGLADEAFLAGKEEFPIRLVVIGKREMYDILYMGKADEILVRSILTRIQLPDCKHIVVLEDMSLARNFPVKNVFAFCTVTERGKVRFYEG